MPFVKLDCGMLDSTIWIDREAREIFITALLMAEPMGTSEPQEQLRVRNLELTGFVVPPGAYGFVPAAGVGIVRRSGLEQEVGLAALERLGDPEVDSRDPAFEGRRMVRVNRGYLILNYSKFRAHDYTTAERSKRYREKLKLKEINEQNDPSRRDVTASRRDITQALALAEADTDIKSRNRPNR